MTIEEYTEMMLSYIPDANMPLIKDAWKHNATAMEVKLYLDRIKVKDKMFKE